MRRIIDFHSQLIAGLWIPGRRTRIEASDRPVLCAPESTIPLCGAQLSRQGVGGDVSVAEILVLAIFRLLKGSGLRTAPAGRSSHLAIRQFAHTAALARRPWAPSASPT